MNEEALARLRDLLARGQISEADFALLSGGATATTLGARAAYIGGPNHGPIHTGDEHHHYHAAPGADPELLRRAYLRRVWKECDALALRAGGDTRQAVRLGAVYTALMTEVGEELQRQGRGAEELLEGRRRMLSAVEMLDRERHLVVLGGPGSGKSTFINYVAQAMAGELLGAEAEAPVPQLATLTAPLPKNDGEDDGKPNPPQPWRHGALLPLVVVLRDLATQLPPAGQPVGAEDVWRYVSERLKAASLDSCVAVVKQELLDAGGLVLFDGLDEVPDALARRKQIRQVVLDFTRSFSRCRVVVTSRTYAYQDAGWKLPGFAEAPLAPFTPPQIAAFVHAWYAHMVALVRLTETQAESHAAILLDQVRRNPRVAELAQRPLLLTLFARLQTDKGGQLPERREELYDAAVEMLLNDWERLKPGRVDAAEREPSLTEWLNASRDAIRRELDRLAFEAHRDQQDLQGTASIATGKLAEALLRASSNPDVKVRQLEIYLRDRAGILVEEDVGQVHFPHRSFQEYLAACHLANDDYPDKLAGLFKQDVLRWREVALLAAARAARGNAEHPTWLLVDALCPEPQIDEKRAGAIWAALLAGQVVVAAGQHLACRPRNKPRLKAVRAAQLALLCGTPMALLPLADRALAGRTLAALDDPRSEVMTLDGMQFCWVPPGPFQMGGDDLGDGGPAHTVELSGGYFIGRYPVTTAQWAEYLRRSGVEAGDVDSVAGAPNEPAAFLSWTQALAFCTWMTRDWAAHLPPGWRVCLPSEAEWEKAARGGDVVPADLVATVATGLQDLRRVARASCKLRRNGTPGRSYPWGAEFDSELANVGGRVGQRSAVGACGAGRSPYGCEEMAGNVWEWTRSLWGTDPMMPSFGYPYREADAAREDESASSEVLRVVRGGSFDFVRGGARCAFRLRLLPDGRLDSVGFRVVLRCARPL